MELFAPGKVFLAGEYAVLEPGWPALVLAVDRGLRAGWHELPRGEVELVHGPSRTALLGELHGPEGIAWSLPPPPELRFAAQAARLGARLCAEEGRAPRGFSLTFLDELAVATAQGPLKLGLGGSACATVLALRAACLAHGRVLAPREVLALAHASHWAEQGGSGSGGDIAASALGGALVVRALPAWDSPRALLEAPARALLEGARLSAQPLSLPDDARFLLAWSGQSADTRALVREVRGFAEAQPARWQKLAEDLAFCAESLQSALEQEARKTALTAIRRAAVAMAALGEAAGTPILTPELLRICTIAARAGSAGKPSGAGGGDCAVILSFGDEARALASAALTREGIPNFPVSISPSIP